MSKTPRKKAWEAFSKYIRLRDALATTGTPDNLICVTCEKAWRTTGRYCAQAGHFISGRNNSILLDEKFVNGQCPVCNKHLRGNFVRYEMEMLRRYGEEAVDEVKQRSLEIKQMKKYQWEEAEQKYKDKYKKLLEQYETGEYNSDDWLPK